MKKIKKVKKFPPLPPDQVAAEFFWDDPTKTSGLCYLPGKEDDGVRFNCRAEFQGAMEKVMLQMNMEPAANQVPFMDEMDMRGILETDGDP